jgi:hypothetical protein
MNHLIGLYSPRPKCGKSSIASQLWKRDWERISFADPLRRMVCSFLQECGIDRQRAWELLTDDALKELPIDEVPGRPTARHLMRTLGTEWGRDCVTQKVWTEIARGKIGRAHAKGKRVVVDDMRFANEFELIGELGGLRVRIDRPQAPPLEGEHPSDGALDGYVFDEAVLNDSDDISRLETIALRLFSRAAGLVGPKGDSGWSGPKAFRDGPDGQAQALFVRKGETQWRTMAVTWEPPQDCERMAS